MAKEAKQEKDERFKGHDEILKAVRTLDDLDSQVEYITTDSLIYDIFLGGGFSPGLSRFVGEPEHGKTLQALTWAKNWILKYGEKAQVYYFDTEGRMTTKKIKLSGIHSIPKLGSKFTIIRQNCFDDIASFIRDLMNDNPNGIRYFFVFDSLDMLITKANLDKNFSEAEKVGAAQVMSTLLMKHVGVYLADRGHHLQVLSQIRANINVQNPNSPKTKMSGANALRHASDLTGEIVKNFGGNDGMYIFENPKGATVKEKGNIIGHYFTVKFSKTMNEKTGHTIRIPIKRGSGIWREREVTDLAIAFGQFKRESGAWYTLENKDWIARINADLTKTRAEKFLKDEMEKWTAGEGKDASKAKVTEKQKELADKAKSVKFEVELTWQGYPKLFEYIEANPDLVDWLDKEFRATLINGDGAASVSESDEESFE